MATITRRLSLEEFFAVPEFDARRLELIDGEVYEEMSPSYDHGRLAIVLGAYLNEFGYSSAEARAIIPHSDTIGPSAPLPDVLWSRELLETSDWVRTPPGLMIEVLSVGRGRCEMRIKIDLYLGFGVPTVWVIDGERESVEIYDLGTRIEAHGTDKLRASEIPELDLSVAEMFALLDKPRRR